MKGIELINASAGSGKTYSLTHRVLQAISNGLSPDALLATTFTKKAAAELQERIRQALLQSGNYDAAQTVFDGFIGTVNSVCARLLTEYALDAGLSPALDVMPEEDSQRMFGMAISSVIEKHASVMETVARRLSRVGEGVGYAQTADWRNDVKSVVEMARANLMDAGDLARHAKSTWDAFRKHLGQTAKGVTFAQLTKEVKSALVQLHQSGASTKVTAGAISDLEEVVRLIDQGKELSWKDWAQLSKVKAGKSEDLLVEPVRELAQRVLSNPDLQQDIETYITVVFDCAAEALSLYAEFKREQGLIDFVDQEAQVLDLAQNNASFQASVKERFQQIMVDEFQDTSPIQLALFLALHELVGRSVWVGDPKQAIYGFRGTDPQLMEAVAKTISETSTLGYSWRSRELLVNLSNAVFANVFHGMSEDQVKLGIPDKRRKQAAGGWIEAWHLTVKNNTAERAAIADGIQDLLKTRQELAPADIAILCKTNGECAEIAAELESRGIRASASQGDLLQTRECQLAMAGLRYLHDDRDTVALAEIVHLSPHHANHHDWLQKAVTEKEQAFARWKEDPMIRTLDERRQRRAEWTPLEALEEAIAHVRCQDAAVVWGQPAHRLTNLDHLRAACSSYLDRCRAHRSAGTITGFLQYLQSASLPEAKGEGRDTVQVLTYHSAKGLEWPVVILYSLDKQPRSGVFGGRVIPAPHFDHRTPLKDRRIHFWPWPFGALKTFDPLEQKLADTAERKEAERQARHESHRLMYVGVTRARDGLVFVMRRTDKDELKTGWLDELSDASSTPVLSWPLGKGAQKLTAGKGSFPVHVRTYDGTSAEEVASPSQQDSSFIMSPVEAVLQVAARRAPSSVPASLEKAFEVKLRAKLGERLPLAGKSDMDRVGSAIHAFLGMDNTSVSEAIRRKQADSILKRWDVAAVISTEQLLAIHERLYVFIRSYYPDAIVRTEWPIMIQQGNHQITQGWIDLLLELPEGYVVIDHKSYPGVDVQGLATRYAGQLGIYQQALEAMSGKRVLESLLHLPLLGKVVGIEQVSA